MKKRLETQADSTPIGGLANAFAGLDVQIAPAAPAPASPPSKSPKPSKPGRVVLRRERAHRGGKTVIVVDDFAAHHSAEAIADLARELRAACGCGGTVGERTIEIQGDQPAKIRAVLEAAGFTVAGVR